ncbi:MAG: phenylalanine--tRNA ligase subunit beta, partial [Candidatus Eremiobacteraeota bacterium]|nr:phenylalanine--tRNA ligase subunit beta [Candidatus Eremiobacteraeota bacterium]
EIANRLAMLGFPVEEIEHRPQISGVVGGRILELGKHPNADRLSIARVDVGAAAPLTIATAATNVAAGQSIAVATIGAQLPTLRIERRTMRGVVSEGMLISADELALPSEWFEDGILQLDSTTTPGSNVVELLGLADDVLEVEITPNRPDALSILGLARELAASYGVALESPLVRNPGEGDEPPGQRPHVVLESPDCRRFVAQRFNDVVVGVAPTWVRVRLALAGQRPINSLVDVSNYVMLETGQPLHFYDASAVDGSLIVRDARDGERVVTLDGIERTLTPQALVIADERKALCLAGVMGASVAEVAPATTSIVLEAANFNGARIRRTSKALALRSEASTRHEKSLALALTDSGAARAAQLLAELGATPFAPRAYGEPVAPAGPISLPVAEVSRILGLSIPQERIAAHLRALGCVVELTNHTLSVTPPLWRRDLCADIDLIEEIARIERYDRIEASLPPVPAHEISSAQFDLERRIAQVLASLGYREVIALSLQGRRPYERLARAGVPLPDAPIEVLNPLSEEQRFLRNSLLPGLLEYLHENQQDLRVFEIGQAFTHEDGAFRDRTVVTFGFSAGRAPEPWRDDAFLQLKGDAEVLVHRIIGRRLTFAAGPSFALHAGKSAILWIGSDEVGSLGCVDPRLANAFELQGNVYLCTLDLGALPPYETPHYRAPSKFPSTYRDLAIVVDTGVTAAQIENAVARALGALGTNVTVFDEYRGPQVSAGRKSLAVRMTLQRFDTTITDAEADAAVATVVRALGQEFAATLRA